MDTEQALTRGLHWLNNLPREKAVAEFLKCCGSETWARKLEENRPFKSLEGLYSTADTTWWALDSADWLAAFSAHPKIGEKKASSQVSATSQAWSGQEQSGIHDAAQTTLQRLATLNSQYQTKFGFIFIVCATGKSSEEMLAMLIDRLENELPDELPIAAAEQAKITRLRLAKLLAQ
jgi:OHCU decarboxylase